MSGKQKIEIFSTDETKQRVEAAVRGAFNVAPKKATTKRAKTQRGRSKKSKSSAV